MPYYNPEKHNRKSIRQKGYDYSIPGWHFVTFCLKNSRCMFGKAAINACRHKNARHDRKIITIILSAIKQNFLKYADIFATIPGG